MATSIQSAIGKMFGTPADATNMSITTQIRRFIESERIQRQEWERKSYVNMMFKQGFHWVNDSGVPDIRDPNLLRRHVNKYKVTLRALRNTITFSEPLVDVIPDKGQKVDQRELDLASAIIRSEFERAGDEEQGINMLVKNVIDDGALKSFAFMSVLPNNDPKDNRLTDIRLHDPLDVFFDNPNMKKAQMVVVSSYEDKEYLKQQGFENVKDANDTGMRSHSILKNEFEKVQRQEDANFKDNMLLIDNVYFIQFDQDEDENFIKDSKKVMNIVVAGDTILREKEELEGYDHLGQVFFPYYMEKEKHVKYPTPWMSDVIPLQRSLNDASENIDTILHWFAKVRFMQRSGSSNTVQLIGDQHVQKIRFSGERPIPMEMPNPPSGLFDQIQMRDNQIEDMVGMHAASLGRLPADRASGRLTALLQAGDVDNVAEPVSNLEDFLNRVFIQVLSIAADNMVKVTKIHGDEGEEFEAIGVKAFRALSEEKRKGVTEVKKFKNIKTTVTPGNNVSLAQVRNEILEILPILTGAQLLEESRALTKVLLEQYNTGLAKDVFKAIEREREEEAAENADTVIIRMEIEKMARGEPVTATPEQPHKLHVDVKTQALSGIVEKHGRDIPQMEIFMNNISQHQSFLQGGEAIRPEQAVTGVT